MTRRLRCHAEIDPTTLRRSSTASFGKSFNRQLTTVLSLQPCFSCFGLSSSSLTILLCEGCYYNVTTFFFSVELKMLCRKSFINPFYVNILPVVNVFEESFCLKHKSKRIQLLNHQNHFCFLFILLCF